MSALPDRADQPTTYPESAQEHEENTVAPVSKTEFRRTR